VHSPSTQTDSHPSPWGRLHWLAVLAAVALGLGLGWRDRAPEVSLGGDEATHVALSYSLEHGGYQDEFIAGSPPHIQYPPGTAIWFMTIRQIFGPNLDWARAANLILLGLTALLIGDAVRRLGTPWLGVSAVSVVALNPALLQVAGTLLSDSLYIALATLSVWATLRADSDWERRWWILATSAGIAAFLTRTVGIALLFGLVGWYCLRRRWALAALTGTLFSMVVLGWAAYLYTRAPSAMGSSYMANLAPVLDQPSVALTFTQGAWRHLKFYVLFLPGGLFLPTIGGTPIDNLAWYLVLAACGGFGMWKLARQWPATVATLIVYFLILLAWRWQVERLMLPLFPSGLAALLVGTYGLTHRMRARSPAMIGVGLAMVMSGSSLLEKMRHPRWAECDRSNPYGTPSCFNPKSTAMVRAAWVIRDNFAANAVIATSQPATIHYFSGRRTLPLEKAVDQMAGSQVPSTVTKPQATVWLIQRPNQTETRVYRILRKHCRRFREVASVEPPFLLLRASNSHNEEGDDACPLLQE